MRMGSSVIGAMLLIGVAAGPVFAQSQSDAAQDRQFMFSVSTLPREARHVTVNLESAVGERAFDVNESDRPEQRIGIQADLGHRFTFLGRVGVSSDRDSLRSSQQGELLYRLMQSPKSQGSLALGLGIRHESAGTNVLLARMAAGRAFHAWRLDGNALLEKPYSTGRDAVDLITSVGVSRHVLSVLSAGLELIGEDLEGFWEEEEAEGGARVLIGPSLRIAPPARQWQIGIAGGPIVHATRSGRSSDASRGLPQSNSGYAIRVSFSYGFSTAGRGIR